MVRKHWQYQRFNFFFFNSITWCVWVCVCALHMCSASKGLKRVLDPLELELRCYEIPCSCWELNLGPMEEQSELLTIESSLQSQYEKFKQIQYYTFLSFFPPRAKDPTQGHWAKFPIPHLSLERSFQLSRT